MPPIPTDDPVAWSVCMSVCLSFSVCISVTLLLSPLVGMACHLAGTFVWFQVTLYWTGAPVPPREGEIWGDRIGDRKPQLNCTANCSGILTMDSLNDTIDSIRLPLSPIWGRNPQSVTHSEMVTVDSL